MSRRIGRSFFSRGTLEVARDLLGQRLVRRVGSGRIEGAIVEVEAYIGEDDGACHARHGPTGRAAPLYGAPGDYYVYLIYGMYWCLNVVTEREGYPAAVLVRAVEPIAGLHLMRRRRIEGCRDLDLARGPGRLCQAMAVDGRYQGRTVDSRSLFLERGPRPSPDQIVATPRIGIDYAGESRDLPWRLHLADSAWVSGGGR